MSHDEPIVKDGRDEPKTRPMFMGRFSALLAAMFASRTNPTPTFRGANYAMGWYNPIFIPRRGKFKGYMRENRRNSFNKNK